MMQICSAANKFRNFLLSFMSILYSPCPVDQTIWCQTWKLKADEDEFVHSCQETNCLRILLFRRVTTRIKLFRAWKKGHRYFHCMSQYATFFYTEKIVSTWWKRQYISIAESPFLSRYIQISYYWELTDPCVNKRVW